MPNTSVHSAIVAPPGPKPESFGFKYRTGGVKVRHTGACSVNQGDLELKK